MPQHLSIGLYLLWAASKRVEHASLYRVNEGDQTLHELGAAPVVFRPLVEIDHQS